jgi:hypothetical protein
VTRSALRPEPHVIVVFGGNGDLARRKLLPALFHLYQEGLMPERFAIIGSSRGAMTDHEFRRLARASVDEFCKCAAHGDDWSVFASRLTYVSHEFVPGDTDPIRYAVVKAEAELGGDTRRLFYLAVPPPAFGPITQALGCCGLTERARVVYEKPFGADRRSFRELSATVSNVLDETQTYRIDHFLGKESVQNILALRFANGMFEPVWNRDHIDHVQIDVPRGTRDRDSRWVLRKHRSSQGHARDPLAPGPVPDRTGFEEGCADRSYRTGFSMCEIAVRGSAPATNIHQSAVAMHLVMSELIQSDDPVTISPTGREVPTDHPGRNRTRYRWRARGSGGQPGPRFVTTPSLLPVYGPQSIAMRSRSSSSGQCTPPPMLPSVSTSTYGRVGWMPISIRK